MSQPSDSTPPPGKIVLYQPGEDSSQIRVLLEGETVWLTQHQIADLYQTTQQNVSLHVRNIYEEGELAPETTHKDFLLVRQEGNRQVNRRVAHYNLDAILAVGYRVKSPMATRFRQWATARLSEYLVKGFTLNDERLKGTDGVTDYYRITGFGRRRIRQPGRRAGMGTATIRCLRRKTPPRSRGARGIKVCREPRKFREKPATETQPAEAGLDVIPETSRAATSTPTTSRLPLIHHSTTPPTP